MGSGATDERLDSAIPIGARDQKAMRLRMHTICLLLAWAGAMHLSALPAYAAKCFYSGYDQNGILFHETGRAVKYSNACARAKRQCNRKLKRWMKKGKVARGAGCSVLKEAG